MKKLFNYSRKCLFSSQLCSIPEPTPSTMTALHQFGAEMLKLSRGLQSFAPVEEASDGDKSAQIECQNPNENNSDLLPSKHHKANVERYAKKKYFL
jgi:hypothetical protein